MTALAAVAPWLRCPVCGGSVGADMRCAGGHSFDVARAGYVSLVGPHGAAPGDTASMVAARAAFLGAGHYAPIAGAVVRAAAGSARLVADLGAGTGYYLAAVLDALPGALGVAFDSSPPALRRAARAHPRAAAVGADVWRAIPLADDVAGLVLIVFSPRNGAEVNRVLKPGGSVVVVTPTERHLRELADLTIGVEAGKRERLHAALMPLRPTAREPVEFTMDLDDDAVQALIGMGPSARHTDPSQATGRTVTASVNVETFRG